ncbi:MAG: anti-sigma factor [Thermoactinomyces sp.]
MNHVNEMLSAYLDDELSRSEKEVVEQHLQTCSNCQDLLDQLIEMKRQLVFSFEEIDVPAALTNKVMFAIDQQEWTMMAMEEAGERQSMISNRALQRSVIGSILLLFIANGVFIFAFGSLLSFHFLSFFVSLSHAVLTLITAIPYVGMIVSITSLFFIAISVWCLRQLLSSKKVEVLS